MDIQGFFGLAQTPSRSHATVTVLLVQNGVLAARAGEGARWIDELSRAGVEVVADELSLRERWIPNPRLARRRDRPPHPGSEGPLALTKE